MPVLAASDGGKELSWFKMGMSLCGGLALFLFGMEQMGEALKMVAGDRMRDILAKLTTNRLAGLLTGAGVTAVIQSSSVTTVMLVGFVSAGLMSLSQAIGVILGADIGTTITAQIVAFPVKKYALLLVTVGFVLIFVGKKDTVKQYGALIMGLGMVFFGMGVMSDAMKPMRSYQPFIELMHNVDNPVVGILIATAFTSLIQSSSATMGVVIVLAQQGLITLEGGIALALGANIGTCATAGLASIGKPREAVRVAVAHVTFKIAGVLLIVWFIPPFADLVRAISPAEEGLTGAALLAAEVPRQVANAHTVFNIGIAFLFLPASALFARFCEWVVPDREVTEEEIAIARVKPKYLDDTLLETPALALDRSRLELERIGHRVRAMYHEILPAALEGTAADLDKVAAMDEEVDALHAYVVDYLRRVGLDNLTDHQSRVFMGLIDTANNFENIGDIIETDMVHIGRQRLADAAVVSESTSEVMGKVHAAIGAALDGVLEVVVDPDRDTARQVVAMKGQINDLADSAALHGAQRLVADEPNRLKLYTREMELLERMKRIYYFVKRIAKSLEGLSEDEAAEDTAAAPPQAPVQEPAPQAAG
ncbi:MAG: Na/Pi cotransporter family protein [Hyphomicrobiales bacterium]|nr:Na/Pi cotransporter family protein [Hyphomicrobiales bacterium]MCP5374264.1 Na/Pi cotransporter family protein [Hyphomicrobiales bacterium]